MAVPSSGQLTMVGIYSEKNEDDYTAMTQEDDNISLRGLSSNSHNDSDGGNMTLNTANNPSSNRPDQNAPHLMSEFYAYDHDAVKSDLRLKTNINLLSDIFDLGINVSSIFNGGNVALTLFCNSFMSS